MRTLHDVLAAKGTTVYSVRPDDTIFDAVAMMKEKGVGALLVVSEQGVAGIVSERDVAREMTLAGRIAKQTPAADVMTAEVTCVEPDLDIQMAMALMTEKRIRHLPVTKAGQLVGVVSIGDLVKAVIDDQQFTIQQLEHYITT